VTRAHGAAASAARYHPRPVSVPPSRHSNEAPSEGAFGEAELRRLRAGHRPTRDRLWEALDAALRHRIVPGGDRVAPRFRAVLVDVPTAEDFIADRIVRIIEGLEAGRVGRRFDERSGDLVGYLTQSALLLKKAIQWRASRIVDAQSLGDDADDGYDPIGGMAVAPPPGRAGRAGDDRRLRIMLEGPLEPELDAAGGPTQRRFVCIQFWPRLAESARDRRRTEVAAAIAPSGATFEDLEREHREARTRIARDLRRVAGGRDDGRPLTPRAAAEAERLAISLRVEALFHPLDAAAVRRLLAVSEANAHQLKRRLVANLPAILPGLARLLSPEAEGDRR
jgi:hypothetical protein